MMRSTFILCLFLYGCASPPLESRDVEGTYRYTRDGVQMILNINHNGRFRWSIFENSVAKKTLTGEWEIYDEGDGNIRLIVRGFCFPKGVTRTGECSKKYPAIIEKDTFSGKLTIPIDVDHSDAALIKIE